MKDVFTKAEFEHWCRVWRNGILVPDTDPCEIRMDEAGALIKFLEYGEESEFGWQIEHSYPEGLLKDQGVPQKLIDDYANLRPMHWRNNGSKSENYPTYRSAVVWDGTHNVDNEKEISVSESQRKVVEQLYGDGLKMNPVPKKGIMFRLKK